MARITAIINQKGGVGKTTTAHALTTGLTSKGFKTLAIDADPQCNLSYNMRGDPTKKGLFDALNEEPIQNIIQHVQGDILTSSQSLINADKFFDDTGREYLIKTALEPLQNTYDFIIIDCPPSVGILSINALTSANDIIIPTTADYFSLQGLGLLFSNITKVKKHCNPNIKISGLLLVRYNNRTILNRDLRNNIETEAKRMNTKLYHAIIRENISIREAQAQRESIFKYAPQSNAAIDYENFIKEYINNKY